MTNLKTGILYNLPAVGKTGAMDIVSEAGVLVSVAAVKAALDELGMACELLPVGNDLESLLAVIKQVRPDVIFNLGEGVDGDSRKEMCLPALLELLGLPYTGSPGLTLGLCQDKIKSKAVLLAAGINTPRYKVAADAQQFSELEGLRFPVIVKPAREDASLGIDDRSVVYDRPHLEERVGYIISAYNQPALVEEYIEGREFNVSVLGNGVPMVLPVSELDFSGLPETTHRICSYKAKWIEDAPEYHKITVTCPAQVSARLQECLERVSLAAYAAMDCRDYARIDIRVDGAEEVYVLEVNPNPDIAPDAGLARSLKHAGIPYNQFIRMVLTYAWERRHSYSKI